MNKGIKFECLYQEARWDCYIISLDPGIGNCEFVVEGRGSQFHIIMGEHESGFYVCIPNHNIGSELGNYTDSFWNMERLSGLMGRIDAITVSTAIAVVGKLL